MSRTLPLLTRKATATHTQTMRTRIDSELGRYKVDGQWKLFALVRNIEKWAKLRKVA